MRQFPAMALAAITSVVVTVLAVIAYRAEDDRPSRPHAQDPYRPVAHFAPESGWMNDPNGLIYLHGRYHLFYQANPATAEFGDISWGHAVSTDLIHWRQQPIAIPHDPVESVYSGSVVLDAQNTSGFGTADRPALVAIYTSQQKSTGIQQQALAYSTDDGEHWRKYDGNPVLALNNHDFRDPKVFWYAPEHSWRMTVVLAAEHKVQIYSSPDLKSWTYVSDFGPAGVTSGVWECPDLFPLDLDGDPRQQKWVMVVNVADHAQYFVGSFDGTRFVPDDPDPAAHSTPDDAQWIDHGQDFYAATTFNDAPDGKRIMLAWMGNWAYNKHLPTDGWKGQDTTPRELALRTVAGRPTLVQQPVAQLASSATHSPAELPQAGVADGQRVLDARARAFDLSAVLRPGTARRFGLDVRVGAHQHTRIGYDRDTERLFVDRSSSGAPVDPSFGGVQSAPATLSADGALHLRIIVDHSSVEVFTADGQVAITDQIYPDASSDAVRLFADGGDVMLTSARLSPLGAAAR